MKKNKKTLIKNLKSQYVNVANLMICIVDKITKKVKKMIMSQKLKEKVKSSFIVINEKGLHTRPSTELVKCASTFKSQVSLIYQNVTVNAKSLLGILMLAAARGAKIKIEAEGEDASEAVRSILDLAKNKFHIKY